MAAIGVIIGTACAHSASSKGLGEPWPLRPNANKTGMNQNLRQWLLFISLAFSLPANTARGMK